MNRIRDLADRVEREWRATGHDLTAFPNVATRALQDLEFDLTLKEVDQAVAKWLISPLPLPDQVNVHNTFGQPPLTLFNNGRFVVDLYFWLNFDTSIHSHGFRGAFRVLHGRSLQEVFRPRVEKEISVDVALVHLGEPDRAFLNPGDVRTIEPGRELTHRVVHLENPTLTLCVKTINEPELRQWSYFTTGLAIQRRPVDASLAKRIYYYQYLTGRDRAKAEDYLQGVTGQLSLAEQMNLFEDVGAEVLGLNDEVAQTILESLYQRHAESDWFQRYEQFNVERTGELGFTATDDPAARLLAHLINSGVPKTETLRLLEMLGATNPQDLVWTLLEIPDAFLGEMGSDDREAIRTSLKSGTPLPEPLRDLGQVAKLRHFLSQG